MSGVDVAPHIVESPPVIFAAGLGAGCIPCVHPPRDPREDDGTLPALADEMMLGDGPGHQDRPDPLVGQTLKGTYRMERLVAEGGMGAVYVAQHVRLGRRVAVKVVLPHSREDERYAARFRTEVDAIAQVDHPHIVQVFDFDVTESGAPYLVMEYLDGETLEAHLEAAHRLPVQSALTITSQVASALAEVHARGIVHRDLKPANIFLVEATGEHQFVKLLDFGVSQSTGRRRITGAREIVGTPEYMAPEQAQGKTQDARADQFALAAITYEMLTGRTAFEGDSIQSVLLQVLSATPPRVSHLAPWVPDVLDTVLDRALSKDPADRFPTISQFAYALESAAAHAGIHPEARSSRLPGARSTPSPVVVAPSGVAPSGVAPSGVAPSGVAPSGVAPSVAPTGVAPSVAPTAVAPSETPTAVARRPSSPVGGRATPPPSSEPPASGHNPEATALFVAVRRARDAGDLASAVESAEKLLELAAYEKAPGVLGVLARAMPVLEEVFESYVGPLDTQIAPGPSYEMVRQMRLSPRAAQLLASMDRPTSIATVFADAGVPTKAGRRMLAGLMRRGVVRRV